MDTNELLSVSPTARRSFLLGLTFAAIASVALLAWTLSLATAITTVVEGRPLGFPLLAFVLFLALRVGTHLASARALSRSSAQVRSALRARLATTWTTSRDRSDPQIGIRSTLLGPGIDSLDGYVTAYLPARLLAGLIPTITLLVIGFLDPWTVLILLFAGPMLLLLLAFIGARTRALADRRFTELGWLRSFYLDMVRGLPTLKVFHRTEEGTHTIEGLSDRLGRSTMDVLRTAFQTSLVIEWAATAATALVAVQVSFRLIDGDIGFGAALAVLMLTPEFFTPLRTLAVEYHAGQTGNAVLAQLAHDETPHHDGRPGLPTAAHAPLGTVTFESVSFRYPDSPMMAIDDFSLTIQPGETVALIGPSGCGKSTIARLLMGQVRPAVGRISVDGVDLDSVNRDAWLAQITSVPQNPFLFRASIRDNVLISNPDASDDEFARALALAQGDGFVAALPEGIASLVGENGATLSGGQRQRLAIARALLRPAPLVVLDEFTAHLDPETEARIIESIRPFLRDRTVLIIAHREATLALADRVISVTASQRSEVQQ